MTDVYGIEIPPSAFGNTTDSEAGIVFGFYSTSTLFPLKINATMNEISLHKTIGSAVLAAKIAGQTVENLLQPALINLTIKVKVSSLDHTTEHYGS